MEPIIHFGKTRHIWRAQITYTARCGESGILGVHVTYTHTKVNCLRCICALIQTKKRELAALESKFSILVERNFSDCVDTDTSLVQ